LGLIAICATAAFFTGCGDDHDDNNPPGNTGGNAPASLNGQTYTLNDTIGGGTLAFESGANNYTLTRGGTNEVGTFVGTKSDDVWTVTTMDTSGTTNSTITLTFTGAGSGNYTQQTAAGDQISGTFASAGTGTTTTTGTDTGTTTNTGTDTGTTTSTGTDTGTTTGTVPAPATLQSITVTTAQSGIGPGSVYTVTFSGGTTGTFTARNTDNNVTGTGNYTYTPQGNQAHLRMDYSEFAGDFDDMTLIFTTPPGGGANQFAGNQKVGGTDYTFTGTFTY